MQQTLIISDNKKIEAIAICDILYLESNGARTTIYCKNQKQVVCSKQLKLILKQLDSKLFFRVHNSHVVNLREIQIYKKGRGGHLVMSDGNIIAVAQLRKEEFLNSFCKK